jgi:hypothetical protein
MLLLSLKSSGAAGGIHFSDEDVLAYHTGTGAWTMYFDGSDVLTTTLDVDALARLSDGALLLSFTGELDIPGLGVVDDSDIVRFVPATPGSTPAGSFEWYFDGSDVGLTTDGEDIDALTVLSDGQLVLSTAGSVDVTGVPSGNEEDLLLFAPSQVGESTSGAWALYFDGSDVELNTMSSEDLCCHGDERQWRRYLHLCPWLDWCRNKLHLPPVLAGCGLWLER